MGKNFTAYEVYAAKKSTFLLFIVKDLLYGFAIYVKITPVWILLF